MKVLFVCLGNICRSPLAEGIARSLYPEYEFDSAGTSSYHIGEKPCWRSIEIAKKKGIDISNLRARQVNEEDKTKWDLVIAMDEDNLSTLKRMGFKNAVMLLEHGVPDPYYFSSDEGMEEIYEMIKNGIKRHLGEA
jgi:protein-tyrosine phosphatase